MAEDPITSINTTLQNIEIASDNSYITSEEGDIATSSDSEQFQTDSLRYASSLLTSTTSQISTHTLTPLSPSESNGNSEYIPLQFQIPIVGYEVMEERARFTVYKLRVENKSSGDCWYVFRRYTDFVRLCNRLKRTYPHIVQYLPRKRWLRNNFDPIFLDQRVNGLQTLVNAILTETKLMISRQIQDFFCLNEPPLYSDTNEESKAMFEALEDTIYQLKQEIKEKNQLIDELQDKLHSKTLENENLSKLLPKTSLRDPTNDT